MTPPPDSPSLRSVGIDPEKLEAVFERAEREVREGLLPTAQVAVARNGRIAGMRTFGRVHPRRPAGDGDQRDALRDLLLHQGDHLGRGVDADPGGQARRRRKVADVIPGFEHERQASRPRRAALHPHGGLSVCADPSGHVARPPGTPRALRRWRLNFEPGREWSTTPTSSMWVIAEIIERRSGVPYHHFVRARIAVPLGLDDLRVGLPPAEARPARRRRARGRGALTEELASSASRSIPQTSR